MSYFVYLIRLDGSSHYKIGISTSPRKRLVSLQTNHPSVLSLSRIIDSEKLGSDAKSVESNLHERFSAKRLSGEWFDLSEEDVAYVMSMPAADSTKYMRHKPVLLGLDPEDYELLAAAAKRDGRPLTQYIIYHTRIAAKKFLENSTDTA